MSQHKNHQYVLVDWVKPLNCYDRTFISHKSHTTVLIGLIDNSLDNSLIRLYRDFPDKGKTDL